MMFKSKISKAIATLGLLTLTGGLAACSDGNSGGSSAGSEGSGTESSDDANASGDDAPQELVEATMMTDVAFLPKHAPFFAAVDHGFFEREGIDLELQPGSGSGNTVAAVDTNRVTFGWADFGVSVLNIAAGTNIKQIALVQGKDAYAVVALEDSGIKDWEDLRGKKLATEGGGAMTAMWPIVEGILGFEEGEVEVVHAASETKIPGILAGQWDANLALFVSDEPVLIGEGHEPVVLKWNELGFQLYGNGIITTQDRMENDPELVRSFTKAITEGFLWACDNQDQAAESFTKAVTGFSDEAIEAAIAGQCELIWTEENEELGYGAMSDEGVQKVIDIAGEYLGLENSDEISPSDIYTNDFVTPIAPDTEITQP